MVEIHKVDTFFGRWNYFLVKWGRQPFVNVVIIYLRDFLCRWLPPVEKLKLLCMRCHILIIFKLLALVDWIIEHTTLYLLKLFWFYLLVIWIIVVSLTLTDLAGILALILSNLYESRVTENFCHDILFFFKFFLIRTRWYWPLLYSWIRWLRYLGVWLNTDLTLNHLILNYLVAT